MAYVEQRYDAQIEGFEIKPREAVRLMVRRVDSNGNLQAEIESAELPGIFMGYSKGGELQIFGAGIARTLLPSEYLERRDALISIVDQEIPGTNPPITCPKVVLESLLNPKPIQR